jgi:tetratricopeptide (TPR) repeat protein
MMASTPSPSVGLAIIARDEERALPRLLRSISGAFDQVALLDTGSTDRTVAVFMEWAAAEVDAVPDFQSRLGQFPWVDDFAAARNAADALLGTDWLVWADADDEVRGAHRLRALAAAAPEDVAGLVAGYETAHTRAGEVLCRADRIRMVRAGRGRWHDPVHERLVVDGPLAAIDRSEALWIHRKEQGPEVGGNARNLRILRRWLAREPGNLRALAHAGREEAERGNHQRAVEYFSSFVSGAGEWGDECAQVHRQLHQSLIALGRLDDAAADAAGMVEAMPDWPDSYLTLAEVALARGDARRAISYANRVLELGPPRSAALQVTTDYTAHPRLLIARAHARAGDATASRRFAKEALAAVAGLDPSDANGR